MSRAQVVSHPATVHRRQGLRIAMPGTPSAAQGTAAAQAQWSQGVALSRAGNAVQALPFFERAVKLSPGVSLYWMNLASTQRKLRRTEAAIESASRSFELDAGNETACHLLAELLRTNNRDAEAIQALDRLSDGGSRGARHWLLRGAVLMSLKEWQAAALSFLQVLSLKPADIEAYMQLGFALSNLKRYAEAAECFRTVTIVDPTQLGAAVYAVHYAAWACDWVQAPDDESRLAQAMSLQAGVAETPSFSPFCLLAMNDDAAMHKAAATIEARRIAHHVRTTTGWSPSDHPVARAALAAGCLRVGFVSADFRTHATSMLLVQTLERLDRGRFEVHLYSHGSDDGTALRRRIEAAADHFVDCTEMNAVQQAARIREDGVALLIDMSGYTASTRLGVFALRPAPVQALWLAYPSTTGSDFIDYLIGDPTLTPLAHAADFTEHIAQLPLCYEPTDELRPHPEASSRQAAGLPDDAFVYACFNQSYKITEPVFTRWCRILDQVPDSVLWLLVPQEEIQAALVARAVERGVDPARLIFAPFVTPDEHLARLPLADLFLDTFPYGAHTTCSDALWMGLPVLTQSGRSFSARVAASLLNAVELSGLAVDNEAEYEARAVMLARDPEILPSIRAHLRDERVRLPLFDNTRFTAELASLFERMVGRWTLDLPPAALGAR